MSIEEAVQKITSYREISTDSKSLKLLNKWNELLLEIQALGLTNSELSFLNDKLDVQIKRKEITSQDRKVIKESLKSTLSFLKNRLRTKDSFRYISLGTFAGLLLPLLFGISIIFGLIIGMGIGFFLDGHFNNEQRNIKTNLHNTW
jgi:hypothetical protein